MVSKEESILFSAEMLFAEKGFDGTSTREISKAANANISLIAYYFGSKEKLLERIFEYRIKESLDFALALMLREDLSAWQKLELLIDKFVDRVRRLKYFYLLVQREKLNLSNPAIIEIIRNYHKEFLKIYQTILKEGNKKGVLKTNYSLELIHYTISGTLFTGINALELKKKSKDFTDKMEQKYYADLKKHLKILLKHLLGYEGKI
ncbi:MAG: TetR/AcrR family transcriptional regulator [Bacteroidetes bacterium]|nr:TetR/AcrR family transcriptional regulator [Bacteroidota bacterium]